MKKTMLMFMLSVITSFSFILSQALPGTLNWYNGEGNGMFTEVAYKKILSKKKSTTVVVAVIDSGVDVEHEDLNGHIWVNAKEIPGNNKDDDGNGYVDDINGWNFLGNKNNALKQCIEWGAGLLRDTHATPAAARLHRSPSRCSSSALQLAPPAPGRPRYWNNRNPPAK